MAGNASLSAEERLSGIPWEGLRGLAPSLDGPLGEVLSGVPAEQVIDRLLRSRRSLGREARCAVAEAVFGVGLWRRRLAWHAGFFGAAADKALFERAQGRKLLFALLRDLARIPGDEAAALLELSKASLPEQRPPPEDLELRSSLPAWLAAVLRDEAGAEAAALAEALALPGPIGLRPNFLRTTSRALAVRLAEQEVSTRPGLLAPGALVVTSRRPNIYGLKAHQEGLFEVQDEGSQLVGALLGARPGESVLDLCAGAGGKALLLAAAVGPHGVVHATDADLERLSRLGRRALRAGAGGLVRLHGRNPPSGLSVDRVLVDAPCSELGALRRSPDARFRIDPATFPRFPPLQLELLERGLAHLSEGGHLLYATCTLRRAENEAVALTFEGRHPELERQRPELESAPATRDGFVRTWPHREGCDGFFAALWQKRAR
ncbi:MAG TPA: RsmB/NOP family class I SAM-dependent RNA methyltransferase [Anaeromyxobacteraceae bacterium]|nr:RsmB/NOP family class I SAM-dependent RNA methyltransferase [Anaeromyxobacteraceae bacterium]